MQAEPEKKGHPYPSPPFLIRSWSLTHSPSLRDAVGVGAYRIFLNQEDKRGQSVKGRTRGENEKEREGALHPASVTRMHMCCALRRYTERLRRRAGVARHLPSGRATSFDLLGTPRIAMHATRHSDGIHRTCTVLVLLLLSFAAD